MGDSPIMIGVLFFFAMLALIIYVHYKISKSIAKTRLPKDRSKAFLVSFWGAFFGLGPFSYLLGLYLP